jgi:signal peptidase I
MNEPMQDAVTPRVDGLEQLHRYARRNPWIAGFCSGIAPGLGQVYNGQATKALLLYGLSWGVALAAFAILLGVPVAPWNVAIPALMVCSWYLYVILDAVLRARGQGHAYHLKVYNKWYVYLLLIAIGAVIGEASASTIRARVVQAFKIPAISMEDTLLVGDHILVNKFTYRWRSPARGELIVYPFPRDPSRNFLHRLVGVPGDHLQVRNHRVHLNGEPLDEPYVKLDEAAVLRPSRYSSWGPAVVPPGKLFVLGDNRDNAADSRDWGFLDSTMVQGRAFVIYWSWDSSVPKIIWLASVPLPDLKAIILDAVRWGRIGKLLY